MKKRFLSILLALCMATQFVPAAALAGQGASGGDKGATGNEGETAGALAGCDFAVTGDAANYEWNETSGVLTITGGDVKVSNKDAATATSQRIYVQGAAHVTLGGVNIVSDAGAPIEIRDYSDTNVALTLEGASTLVSKTDCKAALHKSRADQAKSSEAATLTINGTGSLAATGGNSAAGIGGGGYHGDVHNITIESGTINATGTGYAAGIGSSGDGSTWKIVIGGGHVTANGQPGIGAEYLHGVREASIAGGMVVANSYSGSTPTGGLVSTDGGKSYTLRGDYTLSRDLIIAPDGRLTVTKGAKLTVADGATLTNEGTLVNDGEIAGTLVNNGTVYNKGTLPSNVGGTGAVYEQHVIVNGGTGTGGYAAGNTVTITADNPKDGEMFTGWTVELGDVELANSSQMETTFTMPDGCAVVTANYAEIMASVTGTNGSTTYYSDSNAAQEAWQGSGGTLTVYSDNFRLKLRDDSYPSGGVLDLNGRSISPCYLELCKNITIENGAIILETAPLIMSSTQVTFENITIKGNENGDGLSKIWNDGTIVSKGLALEKGIAITGTGTVTGDIKTALTDRKVTLEGVPDGGFVFNGTSHVPSVKCGDAALAKGADYAVSLSDSAGGDNTVNAGVVTMTITGTGSYSGTVIKTYKIAKADGSGTVTLDGWTYGSAENDPKPTSATNGTDNVTYLYRAKGADDNDYSETVPIDAGTYTVKAIFAATGNYNEAVATADFAIAQKTLTVTAIAKDKTYDGTTDAALSGVTLAGVLDADKQYVALDSGKVAVAFEDKKAGDSKAVTATVAEGALAGDKAGNYTVTTATAENAKISPKGIKATIKAADKTYDGTTAATIEKISLDDAVSSDDVEADQSGAAAAFDSAAAGDNKTVTVTDLALSGNDAGNYMLKERTAVTSAAITQREVTVSGLSAAKTYDGDRTVEKSEITGTPVVGNKAVVGDKVSLNTGNMAGTFDSANVDGAATVTITGISLEGDDAANYKLPETVTCAGKISKAKPEYTAPSGIAATYGQALGDVSLPSGFSWQDSAAMSVGAAGEHTFLATFTPADTANYEVVRGVPVKVTVAAKAIDAAMFAVDTSDATYTGSAVTGRVSSKELKEGADYEVAYSGNVNTGTAKIVITGKGNYEGTLEYSFKIVAPEPTPTVFDNLNFEEITR